MKKLKNLNFIKVYDLQNSSRTNFYKRIIFKKADKTQWSSSTTTLPKNINKKDFDKNPVLVRFVHQLKTSNVNVNKTLLPDFSWACTNIKNIVNSYDLKNYIILFPFCSPHLSHKKWPYFNNLIDLIQKGNNKIKIITAPGPNEINQASEINAISIMDNNKALDISQLASLIKNSMYVIANDTGPAHMAAHLNCRGITLFGHHTSAFKVSIEREKFKPIQVEKLEKLSAEKVFEKIYKDINIIT